MCVKKWVVCTFLYFEMCVSTHTSDLLKKVFDTDVCAPCNCSSLGTQPGLDVCQKVSSVSFSLLEIYIYILRNMADLWAKVSSTLLQLTWYTTWIRRVSKGELRVIFVPWDVCINTYFRPLGKSLFDTKVYVPCNCSTLGTQPGLDVCQKVSSV